MADTSTYSKLRETLKDGFIYGLGTSLSTGIGFLLIPLYTNYFSAAEYGVLSLISITASIVSSVLSLGLISALFRSYYDYETPSERSKAISTTFFMLLLMGLFITVGGFFLSGFLSSAIFKTDAYASYFQVIFVTSSLRLLQGVPIQVLRANKRAALYSVVNVGKVAIQLAFISYFVIFLGLGIFGAIVGEMLGFILSTPILFFLIRSDLSMSFSKFEAEKQLRFGFPLVFTEISDYIINWFDHYFLAVFMTLSAVGVYALGYRIGMVLSILLIQPVKLIWGPMMFSVMNQSNAKRYYSKMLTYVAFLGLSITLAISLPAGEILHIGTNEAYWGASTIIPVICLAYVVYCSIDILNVGIGIKRKTSLVAVYFAFGAVANIALNIALIPKFGYLAAAYTTLASYLVMFAMSYRFNRGLLPVDYEWGRILKMLIVAVSLLLVGHYIHAGTLLLSLLYKLALFVSFPLILYLLNFYQDAELERIKAILAKRLSPYFTR
jgi:O-antigen/teichoic acid export membrane protein